MIRTRRSLRRLELLACVLLLGLLTLAGCSGKRLRRSGEVPSSLEIEEVEQAIANSEAALAAGREDVALEWMYVANEVPGLPTEQRNRVRAQMEIAADQRIARLRETDSDADELARLVEAELPQQIAVSAGIESARIYMAQGEPKKAYRVIRNVDEYYPKHGQRGIAGDIVATAGMELSYDTGGFLFFYRVRNTGKEALEYLVLNYPDDPHCDDAYWRLGEMYEEDEEWDSAIERHEELVIYHRNSEYYPLSLARIPKLRLASIESPEYDRKQVDRARKELEEWLELYPDKPAIEPEVRDDLDDALRRLAQSDLLIAKFNHKVDCAYGVRLHATRALNEARLAGDEGRAKRALDMLARLDPNEGWGTVPVDSEDDVLPDARVDSDRLGTGVRQN